MQFYFCFLAAAVGKPNAATKQARERKSNSPTPRICA